VTGKFVKVRKDVALVPVSILDTVTTSVDKIILERLFHIGPCAFKHPEAQFCPEFVVIAAGTPFTDH
jgi:hypothetical protein